MFAENGISLLFSVAKSCVSCEETVRLCAQILRVIAFSGNRGCLLLLDQDLVLLLEMIFKAHSMSSSVLLHSISCVLVICLTSIFSTRSQLF